MADISEIPIGEVLGVQGGSVKVERSWAEDVPGAVGADAPQAMDPAAQYAALFGTVTPQTRVAAGLPPTGPIAPPPMAQPAVQPSNGGGADF